MDQAADISQPKRAVDSRRQIGRRTLLMLGASMFTPHAMAGPLPCPPPEVLFICPAGTVKSAIARETLKRRAAERRIAIRVSSRGVHPEDHVSRELAAHLLADGIDPRAEPVRALAATDLSTPTVIIAFDEASQTPGLERARVWTTPSWNETYAAAKADLAVRIDALLDELGGDRCSTHGGPRP